MYTVYTPWLSGRQSKILFRSFRRYPIRLGVVSNAVSSEVTIRSSTLVSSESAASLDSTYDATRLRIARWGVVGLLAIAATCAYLTRHGLAVANTTIQSELGLSNEQFGYLYGAFSLGYMLFQIPGGWLGRRFGTRTVLPWCAILWSLMTFTTAVVGTFAGLLLARLLFGVAQAALVPNQGKVIRDWIPQEGRGAATAVLLVAMSVGSIASLSLTSWLMQRCPWRQVFIGYALLGIVWAIGFAIVFRESPEAMGWLRTSQEPPSALPKSPTLAPRAAAAAWSWRGVGNLIRSPSVWGLSVQALFKAAAYNLLVTFLPALLEYSYGVRREAAGSLTAWSLGTFLAGSMLGGWLVDSALRLTGSKFISRSGSSALTLAFAGIFTVVAGSANTANTMIAWLALAGFFSGIAGAAPWVASMDIGKRNTAIVLGLLNSFAALAGTLISPLVGRLIDAIKLSSGSWSPVFWLHAGFYFVAAAAWLVVHPDRPLRLGAESPEDEELEDPPS